MGLFLTIVPGCISYLRPFTRLAICALIKEPLLKALDLPQVYACVQARRLQLSRVELKRNVSPNQSVVNPLKVPEVTSTIYGSSSLCRTKAIDTIIQNRHIIPIRDLVLGY